MHNVPSGGGAWVTTRTTSSGVALVVENTGDRLDRLLVATLAEPFRRGSGRLHDDHGGVGLGLAIVQRIAAAHDGTLALEPRPGGGLVATLSLRTVAPGPGTHPLTDQVRAARSAAPTGSADALIQADPAFRVATVGGWALESGSIAWSRRPWSWARHAGWRRWTRPGDVGARSSCR